MSATNTRFFGPLGSEIHCLRADAATVVAVAGLDWSRWFRRVCLDPVRGVISLMSPSPPHERLGVLTWPVLKVAGDLLGCAVEGLGGPRLRGEEAPPGTGLEPDCAFYLGDRAKAYLAARKKGKAAVAAFVLRTPPDLIVEVEVTHADEGKMERYRDLGAREFWRIRDRPSDSETSVFFYRLQGGVRPEKVGVSGVLPPLTPEAVRDAVEAADLGGTLAGCLQAVTRIIRRCQQESLRVEEERAEYRFGPPDGPVPVPCDCSLHESGDFPRERFLHDFAGGSRASGGEKEPPTSFVGPLGSEIHHLRADAATVAAVARVDWNRRFGRVRLDPVRGVITLMSPSQLRHELGVALGEVVTFAASSLDEAVRGLDGLRFRWEDEPAGTGMEPDGAFYLGERAVAYREAEVEGEAAADSFRLRNGPALVVEVEMTHADEGKMERYRDLGAREFWRIEGRDEGRDLRAHFFRLRAGVPPEPVEVSEALPGLTPEQVCEAVKAARGSRNQDDRLRAVTPVLRRTHRPSVRAREERAGNRAASASDGPVSVSCACSLHVDGASSGTDSSASRVAAERAAS